MTPADLVVSVYLDVALERAARATAPQPDPWVLVECYDRGTLSWRPDPDMDGSVALWRADHAGSRDVLQLLDDLEAGMCRAVVIGGGAAPAYRLRLRVQR